MVVSGNAIAQRTKVTLGITGLSPPRVHIDGEVWHLDVGSSHPGAEVRSKGWAVRPLKWYASWVQNVVRQFGPYHKNSAESSDGRRSGRNFKLKKSGRVFIMDGKNKTERQCRYA